MVLLPWFVNHSLAFENRVRNLRARVVLSQDPTLVYQEIADLSMTKLSDTQSGFPVH
jgi:hypothetical protein